MAAPESVAATSFPFFPLFLSSLSFLILLFLWAKRLSSSRRTRCGEKNHLGLRCDLPAWDSPPPPQRLDEGRDEEAFSGSEEKGRRKRSRKKRVESRGGSDGADEERNAASVDTYRIEELGFGKIECIYPFSSFASSTQRKIKMQYDEIVKSNKGKTLTMAQVGHFIDCLVDARTELQRKSEIIQRSFKIKKALLCKADRSSFDRLCQQTCKLEMEHKRLEEDAIVYNLLQEQLKLSPAYKMLLEASENTEDKVDSDHATEPPDISFEELLAQEKKDMFCQSCLPSPKDFIVATPEQQAAPPLLSRSSRTPAANQALQVSSFSSSTSPDRDPPERGEKKLCRQLKTWFASNAPAWIATLMPLGVQAGTDCDCYRTVCCSCCCFIENRGVPQGRSREDRPRLGRVKSEATRSTRKP